mmetsp:Transcript_41401/g.135146  ORF Transcript_41401/g.135146 Transcript_41401/m.135146 type:complete len:250 (-) Transcript_41401:203-952(-)
MLSSSTLRSPLARGAASGGALSSFSTACADRASHQTSGPSAPPSRLAQREARRRSVRWSCSRRCAQADSASHRWPSAPPSARAAPRGTGRPPSSSSMRSAAPAHDPTSSLGTRPWRPSTRGGSRGGRLRYSTRWRRRACSPTPSRTTPRCLRASALASGTRCLSSSRGCGVRAARARRTPSPSTQLSPHAPPPPGRRRRSRCSARCGRRARPPPCAPMRPSSRRARPPGSGSGRSTSSARPSAPGWRRS